MYLISNWFSLLQCSQNPLSIAKYQNDKEVTCQIYSCLDFVWAYARNKQCVVFNLEKGEKRGGRGKANLFQPVSHLVLPNSFYLVHQIKQKIHQSGVGFGESEMYTLYRPYNRSRYCFLENSGFSAFWLIKTLKFIEIA